MEDIIILEVGIILVEDKGISQEEDFIYFQPKDLLENVIIIDYFNNVIEMHYIKQYIMKGDIIKVGFKQVGIIKQMDDIFHSEVDIIMMENIINYVNDIIKLEVGIIVSTEDIIKQVEDIEMLEVGIIKLVMNIIAQDIIMADNQQDIIMAAGLNRVINFHINLEDTINNLSTNKGMLEENSTVRLVAFLNQEHL